MNTVYFKQLSELVDRFVERRRPDHDFPDARRCRLFARPRKSIGGFTTVLLPQPADCSPAECRMVAPFKTPLRTLLVSQEKVTFALSRAAQVLTVAAPLTGMAEALAAARRDPIGLVATQQVKAEKPSMATLKLRSSQK